MRTAACVTGHVVGTAVGATDNDIAWLKLDAAAHKGTGAARRRHDHPADSTQRAASSPAIATRAGAFKSVAYSADYVFLRKD